MPPLQSQTYKGNCHCGSFKFSLRISEPTCVTECNCSICFRKGYKWIFPPRQNLTVEKCGELSEYEVANVVHKFCPTCGTGVLAQGEMGRHGGQNMGVNARTLKGFDLWAADVEGFARGDFLWTVDVKEFDGAALEPKYTLPPFDDPEPEANFESWKLYKGACHCRAVRMALRTKGQLWKEEELIGECNCSICVRKGTIVTYRPLDQIAIVLSPPDLKLGSYAFASKTYEHKFCSVCGVHVSVDDVKTEGREQRAVNLRCFEGVEWEEIRGRIWREVESGRSESRYIVPD